MPELPRQSYEAPVGRGGTAIEWAEDTINLADGCTKVSPGCAHCYIERQMPLRVAHRRFEGGHIPLRFHPHRLEQPVRRRKPTLYFVNSLTDVFHDDAPAEYVARTFGMMAAAPQHTFQVLTKRHERMRALLNSLVFVDQVRRDRDQLRARLGRPPIGDQPWPLANVWLGVTIENRRFVHRAHYLRATPAAVRFISAEPLLGPLVRDAVTATASGIGHAVSFRAWSDGYIGPSLCLDDIDWLIAGGESGPGYRPVNLDWVRDLRVACAHAGTAFLFKQWGGPRPKSGGRLLDGRTWDEMPAGWGAAA